MAYGAQFSFGVFFSALLDEFGWSRAALSGVFSLYAFGYGTLAFVSGDLTDRWGPRLVIATGGLFLGAGWIAMSFTRSLWQPYVFYGVIAALGMSTAFVPCGATVARWFVRRRGLAAGIASAGGSLGAFALAPLAQLLVSKLGWRWAYVIFGTAILVVLNVLAPLLKRDPETMGLTPDGEPSRSSVPSGVPPRRDYTVRQALRSRAFWMLLALFTATWIPVFNPLVHLVPLARGLGIEAMLAATVVSALGIRHGRAHRARHALRSRGAATGTRLQPTSASSSLPGIRGGGLAARPLRSRDPLRLLLRRHRSALPRCGRRLLRPRPRGRPRGAALRHVGLHVGLGSARRRLHL